MLLYPEQYRKEYGTQIIYTLEDMLANEPRATRRLGIWMREIIVLPGNVLEQHVIAIARRGGPTSAALMGFISLALLVPFFIAMLLDEISERFYNQHLYGSWFWSKPVLTVWIVVLPLLSLFVSLATYVLLTLRANMRMGKLSFQLRRLWLLIATGLIALGVLFIVTFHDSSNCWFGNATSLNRAIQCTESIFLNSDKT